MAETIREYLIALGWHIDEDTWKRYQGALLKTAAETAKVGSLSIETAAAVETMVSRVTRQYENLYYVSQRVGQTVGFLQATQYGFVQTGRSADEALSSMEGVAAALRTQPWLQMIFGDARTPQDIASTLQHSGLPYFLQVQFAQMAGLSERDLLHFEMFGDRIRRAKQEFAQRQREAGIDAQQFADRVAGGPGSFTWSLNRLESDLGITGQRIAMDLIDPVQHGIDALDEIVQWINRVDAATKGWELTLGSFGTTVLAGWLGNKLLRAVLVRLGIMGAAGAGATAAEAATGAGLLGPLALLGAAGYGLYEAVAPEPLNAAEPAHPPAPKKAGAPTGVPLVGAPPVGAPEPNHPMAASSALRASRLSQVVQQIEEAGYPESSALGIASGLLLESGGNLSPTALNPVGGGRGAQGVPQLRGTRLDEAEQFLGRPFLSSSLRDQVNYVLWAMQSSADAGARRAGERLRRGDLPPGRAAEEFLLDFERPGPAGVGEIREARDLAEGLSRLAAQRQAGGGDRSVVINQRTDIHVSSGPTALTTAQEVMRGQADVNADMTRNAGIVLR